MATDLQRAFTPFALGPITLPNRFVKAATYEGMVVDGLPTRSLLRHHAELARSGVGLTTLAYCAVCPDGRTFEQQMVMSERVVPHLARIVQAVHDAGGRAMVQLGHCGGFSKNKALSGRRAPLAPSAGFNAYGALQGKPWAYAMHEEDMEQVVHAFVGASLLARAAGFDAIELHLGHGYLLSQFISPHRNKRSDAWGGPIAHRMRLPLAVVDAVRGALGASMAIVAKINLDDGVKGGLTLDDAVEQARLLEAHGLDGLVLSGGLVSHSAFTLLRGERPLRDMIAAEPSRTQKLALAVFGPWLVRRVPFEPLFWLPYACVLRERVSIPLVLLGGISAPTHVQTALEAGFELVAMGRALIADPDLVARWRAGDLVPSGCVPCNRCIAEMERPGGVCCVNSEAQRARKERELATGLATTPAGSCGDQA